MKSAKVYAIVILSMVFWSMSFVWFKIVVKYYDPITIIFLRLVISGSVLAIYLRISKINEKIEASDRKWFFLLAFVQPFCYFLGESFGLQLVSSTLSAVIVSTIPVFTPIAAFYVFKERVSKGILWGLTFSFVGIIVMMLNPDLSINADPKGVWLLFFAVFSAVNYSLIIRKLAHKYKPVTIITRQNIYGAMYFLPFFLVFDFRHFITVRVNSELILSLLQLALFASTLAYIFFIRSIRDLGVIRANIFTNLIPVFTAVFSFFILSEQFTFNKVAGMMIVLLGVVVSQSRQTLKKLFPKRA